MWAGLAFPCVYVLKDGVCLCVRVTVRLLGLFGPVMATHVPTKTSAEVSVSVRTDGAYSHTLSLSLCVDFDVSEVQSRHGVRWKVRLSRQSDARKRRIL